jgi:ABC-type oligopeptide transport system substrate-binding subunit
MLVPAAGTHRVKDGGTFKVAFTTGFVQTIDPALASDPYLSRPTCGALMSYPDLPPPAGYRIAPDLADGEPVVSRDGKMYAFTVRRDARFSDGTHVTARAFARALERILDPAMESPLAADYAATIVGGDAVLAATTTSLSGVSAKGRTLVIRLTQRRGDFPRLMSMVCAVPPAFPAPVLFEKLQTPGEPFDIGWVGWPTQIAIRRVSSLAFSTAGR